MNWFQTYIVRKAVSFMGNNFLAKLFAGNLGWKTVAAAIALCVLVVLNSTGVILEAQFDQYVRLAEALGLIGLRDAMSKLPK
jgi:hypothetical protein